MRSILIVAALLLSACTSSAPPAIAEECREWCTLFDLEYNWAYQDTFEGKIICSCNIPNSR